MYATVHDCNGYCYIRNISSHYNSNIFDLLEYVPFPAAAITLSTLHFIATMLVRHGTYILIPRHGSYILIPRMKFPWSRNPISFVSVLSHQQLYSIPNPDTRCLVTCDKYSSPQKFHIVGLVSYSI